MENRKLLVLLTAGALLSGVSLRAQQDGKALPTPAMASSTTTTAPLEDRIAAARSVKVMDSILGIALGSELDEAHEKLDPLCAPGKLPKSEGGEDDKEKARDEKEPGPAKASGVPESESRLGLDEDEGHKVLWQLAGTDYSAVYIMADEKEHITSITGIFRLGKEMPFDQVGEIAKAPVHDRHAVVWDVLRADRPMFRVLAKGADGKASTITLFVASHKSLVSPPRSIEPDAGKTD